MGMNTITLRLGDWSNDGHGRTEIFCIKSSLTVAQLEIAFAKGSKKVGFNLTDHCADYEGCVFPVENYEKLLTMGLDDELKDSDLLDEDDEPELHLGCEDYTRFHMFICQLGDPNLVYEWVSDENVINIGGYGLF